MMSRYPKPEGITDTAADKIRLEARAETSKLALTKHNKLFRQEWGRSFRGILRPEGAYFV